VITELFPIVATADMGRALRFYRDLLGGVVSFEYPGPDGAPVYVGVNIGASHLGIGVVPHTDRPPLPRPVSLWVYADDCDVAVQRLRAGGATVIQEPADQPWGERVARVLDPDGNEVIVGQRASG
jgi:lactoylglutathione lyase